VLLLSAGAAARAASGTPAPVEPQTSYTTAPSITGVTADAGWTAWSVQSGPRWQLVLRSPAGVISTPALPSRAIPYDASLGSGPSGEVLLAYSRCSRDPRYAPGGVAIAWFTARGCVVHLLDPQSGSDRALRAGALPAVSGKQIAFASFDVRHRRASIVLAPLSRGRARRVYTGPDRRFADDEVDVVLGPAAVALASGHLAFAWNVVDNVHTGFGLEAFGTNVYLLDRGRVGLVDAEGGTTDGSCTGYTDIGALNVTGPFVIAELTSAVGWELERIATRLPRRGRHGQVRIEYGGGVDYGFDGGYLPSLAVDGQRLVLTGPVSGGIEVGESPLPAFGNHDLLTNPLLC
jgi:hypothetical protein